MSVHTPFKQQTEYIDLNEPLFTLFTPVALLPSQQASRTNRTSGPLRLMAAIAMERAEDRKRQAETCWPNSREIVLATAGEAEAVARDIRRVGRYGRLILSTF